MCNNRRDILYKAKVYMLHMQTNCAGIAICINIHLVAFLMYDITKVYIYIYH